ncbi:PorP/SprF family type IX secretion system membrane protein [Fulvivirga lutimaris]|uniref:PorP/SprF family type IX secretion system membrane protein n=1 Tax=Fulvivirga lutimaris TaxID=1819566 RepID=UPI0012BB4D15|nr:PorP/SprF family type IX secretion system membrane protein [Fulvivirga lutimaris]MTI38320.1 type IX secretion system membrane protein PorP/SprF [Fulvivirga lutimaris]
MRLLILGLFVVLYGNVIGQQQEVYTQYFTNLPNINAGFAGVEDYMDLTLGFRQGWNDFESDNSSVFLSIYSPLTKPITATTKNNSLRISDPSILNKLKTSTNLRRKHGIGGSVSSRKLGSYQSTLLTSSYAYHLPVSQNFNLSFGVKTAVFFQVIDFSEYTVRDPVNDLFYQNLIIDSDGRSTTLVTDFGSVLYTDDFYLGVSSSNMVKSEISNTNELGHNLKQAYSIHIGKMMNFSRILKLSVNTELLLVEGFEPEWRISSRLRYKNLIYAGLSFEAKKRASVLIGLVSDSRYSFHYSYNKYIGDLDQFNVEGHEIIIGISLFNKYRLNSKFW